MYAHIMHHVKLHYNIILYIIYLFVVIAIILKYNQFDNCCQKLLSAICIANITMHIKLSIQFLKVGVYAQLDRLWLHNWQVHLYTCTYI